MGDQFMLSTFLYPTLPCYIALNKIADVYAVQAKRKSGLKKRKKKTLVKPLQWVVCLL